MKKYIALFLAAVMVLTLTACGLSKKDLAHKWTTVDYFTEEEARDNLEDFGFYEEEIALADLTSIGAVRYLTFSESSGYSLGYSKEETKALLVAYYDSFITNLYNNRDKLASAYGEATLAELKTEEVFKEFFALMFSCENYDALLDVLADNTFDLDEDSEIGTYKITGSSVIFYRDDYGDGLIVDVAVEGSTLTIQYTDGSEVYTLAD